MVNSNNLSYGKPMKLIGYPITQPEFYLIGEINEEILIAQKEHYDIITEEYDEQCIMRVSPLQCKYV